MGRAYSKDKGYNVVAELKEDDKGASGAEINLPELNKAREMAQAGRYDVLIVRELDRLSRNLAKQLIVEEALNQSGVRVEYVLAEYDDTPEGRLNKHIRATIAEYEREKIKERLVRGRMNAAKAGKIPSGKPPYGYRVKDRQLVIYEPEAKIVRQIFDWYINHNMSASKIADKLDELNVPTPNSARKNTVGWLKSSVGRMLGNETYTGTWYYGKRRRGGSLNEKSHWVAVEVPGIVSKETFDRAQRQKAEYRQKASRNRKNKYLLSGYIRCACCDYAFSGRMMNKNLAYYTANNGKDYRNHCNLPYFRADILDNQVWNWLVSILTDEEQLEQGFANYKAAVAKKDTPIRRELKITTDLINKKEKELDSKIAKMDALKSKRALVKASREVAQVEEQLDKLEAQHAVLIKQLESGTLTQEQIKSIREFVESTRGDIETVGDDFASRREIVRMLNVQVRVAVEDGKKMAHVTCHLGSSLVNCDTYHILGNAAKILGSCPSLKSTLTAT
ncbi:MAG: hypothetical protein D6768_06750 [Chloroflexi bacterium]|nr:MAG: hypothetical protein D6768_06750 [Chloroflexota bacterium]